MLVHRISCARPACFLTPTKQFTGFDRRGSHAHPPTSTSQRRSELSWGHLVPPGVPFHGPPEPSRNIRRGVLVRPAAARTTLVYVFRTTRSHRSLSHARGLGCITLW